MRIVLSAALAASVALCLGGCGGQSVSGQAGAGNATDAENGPDTRSVPQGGPPGTQTGDGAGRADQGSAAPQRVTEPVREANRMPEAAKQLLAFKHSDQDHHRQMPYMTFGRYDSREKLLGWAAVGWWEQVFDETNSQHCHDLALSNLIVGRFDTAIGILEKRLAAAPERDPLKPELTALLEESRLVKQALTQALDSLRRQKPDLEYPDETVFLAVKLASPNEFLALNVADAHLAAFPESKVALQRAGELSLRVAEADYVDEHRKSNVPTMRRKNAAFWGQTVLERLRELDPDSSYPVVRMMAYELRRPAPRGLDQPVFKGAFEDFDKRTDFTRAEKGFLQFGRAIILLKQENGWGQPAADVVIERLADATRWDPEVRQYAAVLQWVRSNKDQIDRRMLAQRERDTRESERLNAELRRGSKVNGRDAFEDALWGAIRGLTALELEVTKRDDPDRAKLLENGPCTYCFGTGRHLAFEEKCPVCNGSGKYPSLKK